LFPHTETPIGRVREIFEAYTRRQRDPLRRGAGGAAWPGWSPARSCQFW